MKRHRDRILIGMFPALILVAAGRVASAQEPAPINFEDQIKPIIDEYCLFCHRGSRAKNGLRLDSAAGVFEGGSSGPAIEPGDPDNSLLYQLVTRVREPYMPYEDDPLPKELVETIRAWIESGARESATSRPKAVKPKPAVDLSVEPVAGNKPAGEPAMPQGLRVEPYWWAPEANTITALAASPWAPLVAVTGHRQVLLYHAQSLDLLGVLEFPEGVVNILKFSRNGAILIAGGGRSAESGLVVGWDVTSGERLFEIGAEKDAVLAADISNDQRLVALGGPGQVVRVYAVESGSLLYEIDKHTDWITALAFSPDGVLLATGDRSGGLFVWEADTGRDFHTLPPHQPFVTDVSWRADSNVLASCGEDGAVRLFEMNNGSQIKAWSSHNGALSIEFAGDGRLVTCGRDHLARLWDGNGTQQVQFGAMADIATDVAISNDAQRVFVGDWTGAVTVFDAASGGKVGELKANPETRVELAAANAAKQVESLKAQVAQFEPRANEARQAVAAHTEKIRAAEDAARQAEEQAANEQTKAAELAAQAERAEAAAAPLRGELANRQAERDAVAKQLETARAESTQAQTDLEAAMAAALEADKARYEADEASRAAADLRAAQAKKLLEGATALAQMAAAKVAELEVKSTRFDAELAGWRGYTQPKLDEAAQVAQAAGAAQSQAEAISQKAVEARNAAGQVASVMTKLQQQADTAQADLAAARTSLEAAINAAAQAQAAWEAQRAAIEQAGGRVPE